VVRGDVQELASGAQLSAVELMNEELAGGPREEPADDVYVDDIRERIALPRESVDVVL
jgi:hypothetical protein